MLSGLSGQKKQQILQAMYGAEAQGTVVHHTQQFSKIQSAPVPTPDFLEGYNEHIPDGANRLFTMIENQSAHRINMETSTIGTQNKATLRGQWMALATVLVLCGLAYKAMLLGQSTLAGYIFTTTILGVASVFITGRFSVGKSLAEKKPQ